MFLSSGWLCFKNSYLFNKMCGLFAFLKHIFMSIFEFIVYLYLTKTISHAHIKIYFCAWYFDVLSVTWPWKPTNKKTYPTHVLVLVILNCTQNCAFIFGKSAWLYLSNDLNSIRASIELTYHQSIYEFVTSLFELSWLVNVEMIYELVVV